MKKTSLILLLVTVIFSFTLPVNAKQPPIYLYLVQHADRVDASVDAAKPISAKGREDIELTATHIAKQNPDIKEIRHSHQLRAKQTANVLSKHLKGVRRKEVDGLEWDSDIGPLTKSLSNQRSNIMLVGHMPHLGKLASHLVTGNEDADIIQFSKAGIVCLKRSEDGKWKIEWIITPQQLGPKSNN